MKEMDNFMDYIKINKLEYKTLLDADFEQLTENNIIEFSRQGLAVVYAPNGTGKTTISKAMNCEDGGKYNIEYNNSTYENDESFFYIIKEQRQRNIIKGESEDFLVGDNIRREYELKEEINNKKTALCNNISSVLKSEFSITAKSSKLFNCISDKPYLDLLKEIANRQMDPKNINEEDIIEQFRSLTAHELPYEIDNKLSFFIKDIASGNKSIITKIRSMNYNNLSFNEQVGEIEQNDDAILLLNKYNNICQCIVCDNDNINPDVLLEEKSQNKTTILNSLNPETKELLTAISNTIIGNDPFNIKQIIFNVLNNEDVSQLDALKSEFDIIENIFSKKLENALLREYENTNIAELWNEYLSYLNHDIELDEEDMLYIQTIISESLGKDLTVERNENNDIRIKLNDDDFLNRDQFELPLSTGEQNFISLSFELLKAKNDEFSKVIILDDPISSFDSIYKNKIVFAIIKILESKKCIILTHNTDLLRLLDAQHNNCFKLYTLNNSENANNGFIKISNKEKGIMIHLDQLTALFRSEILSYVVDFNLFLVSLIPFMRGYAHILGKIEYDRLMILMHGYETGYCDVKSAYHNLFGSQIDAYNCICDISVDEIMNIDLDLDSDIINSEEFPLLNDTLKHSLLYLQLRLKTEKVLVDKYNINADESSQLGEIIDKAFPRNQTSTIKYRVKLTSKKTIMNEFNHFEGNLSIFQPAIDISKKALIKERDDILELLDEIIELE